jgi:hypothetical protein
MGLHFYCICWLMALFSASFFTDWKFEEFGLRCPAYEQPWGGFKTSCDAEYCSNARPLDASFKIANKCPVEACPFF